MACKVSAGDILGTRGQDYSIRIKLGISITFSKSTNKNSLKENPTVKQSTCWGISFLPNNLLASIDTDKRWLFKCSHWIFMIPLPK